MPLARLARLTADPAGDAELLRRFAAGRDEAAFTELVRRHGPLVRGVCQRMLGATDADDAAQAVFLTLARHAGRVRNADPLAGWLHAVSVRVCRKAWAKRPKPVAAARPAVADPADEASWREVAAAVDAALARLPDRLRQPLVLCYLQGLTRDEAAAKLGWSADTLRGRLDRGRTRLRADLLRRGFGLPAGLLAVLLSVPRGDAAGWAAATGRTVLDPAGPPTAVAALTVGVGWAMRTKVLLGVATVLMAGGLAVSQRPAAEPPSKAEPVPPAKAAPMPKPAEAAKPADPPAATPKEPSLVGTWENVETIGSDGTTESMRLTFTADGVLVSRRVRTGPQAMTATSRAAYTRQGQNLTVTTVELWVNDVPQLVEGKDTPWQIAWGRAGGQYVLYLTTGPRGRRTRYKPAAPDPADAGLTAELARLDRRSPAKNPAYQGRPLYLELTFGPGAARKVWLAVDGERAYLDRNANNDLTDDGEPVAGRPLPLPPPPRTPPLPKGESPQPTDKPVAVRAFALGSITDPARTATYSDITLTVTKVVTRADEEVEYAVVRLRVNGRRWESAGTGHLLLTPRPEAARRLHFDAARLVLQPIPDPTEALASSRGLRDRRRPYELQAQLGTPGIGRDTFVTRSCDDLPDDKRPIAAFAPARAAVPVGDPTFTLAELQTDAAEAWSVFAGTIEGDPFGPNEMRSVTLSFPDYPHGKVEPATYELFR